MNQLTQALKETYGYSDYELALVKYTLISVASELSKLIILGVFYFLLDKFLYFLVFVVLLAFLRINSGGLHCQHYISCFVLTFVMSYFAIVILPSYLFPSNFLTLTATAVCLFVNYFIGPIASPFRPSPDSLLLKYCKNSSFLIIFIFFIIVSIFNSNPQISPYLSIGFWTIILHTMQMIFAKIFQTKGGSYYETKKTKSSMH